MPVWNTLPVLKVDESRMLNVDPSNPENLLGMWSGKSHLLEVRGKNDEQHRLTLAPSLVFHRCNGFIEHGRRLENLSWRVFAHETLCASSKKRRPEHTTVVAQQNDSLKHPVPNLSSSIESLSSVEPEEVDDNSTDATTPAEELNFSHDGPHAGWDCRRLGEKHITPVNLKNLFTSIKEKQDLTRPISPLPMSWSDSALDTDLPLVDQDPISASAPTSSAPTSTAPTPRPSSPRPSSPRNVVQPPAPRPKVVFEHLISPTNASNASVESNESHTSIVRGFEPGKSISTYRSQSSLKLADTKAQASSSSSEAGLIMAKRNKGKGKANMFTLGSSVNDNSSDSMRDNSSPMPQSSLRPPNQSFAKQKKHASFADTVIDLQSKKTFMLPSSHDDDGAIESDDDDEDAIDDSESVIEEDDDEWEDDEEEESAPQPLTFHKVDSTVRLASRRSIITEGLHQGDRADGLQNAASRSSPMLQSSRRSPRNGPSMPSPDEEPEAYIDTETALNSNGTLPMVITTSNMHRSPSMALSPRATRRNMLAQELGVSLRKHMLNERQQRQFSTAPALPRRHTTMDMNNLTQYPNAESNNQTPRASRQQPRIDPTTGDYFEFGLGEYHQKGW